MNDDLEPGPSDAEMEAHEYALEDLALERFPELWKLGTFGDPEFEEALEATVDLIDGDEEDGSTSTAAVKLEMDLEALGLSGDA